MAYKINPFTGQMDNVGSSEIENKASINKLVVTIDGVKYAVARDVIVTPATPTLTAGGTFTRSKTVAINCATTGVTIRYTLDGTDPDLEHGTVGTSVTLNQDTSVESKTYTVKAVAIKNGEVSDVASQTYTINRQVDAPTISVSGNKYSASRTVTITQAAADTLKYKIGASDTEHVYDSSNKPVVSASETVYAYAEKADWVRNSASLAVEIGAKKCYIGRAASLANNAAVEALDYAYEQDTLVGSTKDVDFGTASTEYAWIAIPNTAALRLAVSSGSVPVTLSDADGAIVGDYRVWRTLNRINDSFSFKIEEA